MKFCRVFFFLFLKFFFILKIASSHQLLATTFRFVSFRFVSFRFVSLRFVSFRFVGFESGRSLKWAESKIFLVIEGLGHAALHAVSVTLRRNLSSRFLCEPDPIVFKMPLYETSRPSVALLAATLK